MYRVFGQALDLAQDPEHPQQHDRSDWRAVEQAQRAEEEGQRDGQARVLWRRRAVGAGAVVLRDLLLVAVLGLHGDRIAQKHQAGKKIHAPTATGNDLKAIKNRK